MRVAFSIATAIGGLLVSIPSWAGEAINYAYDSRGQVIGVDRSGSVNDGHAVDITYDKAGNRTNFTASGISTAADIMISSASVTEGGALIFTVTRSGVTASAVSANYATSDGTATSGADYTAASGTVSFSAGETSKTISILTNDDSEIESSETLSVTLSSPSAGAVVVTPVGTGTIIDNDTPPAISVSDATVTEGSNLTFSVTLSIASASTVTVVYATADGTAIAGNDYTAASGILSFAPGETSKSITVATASDSYVESAEAMTLGLSSPTNATIADGSGTGTINNGGSPSVTFSISDASVTEGGSLSFTVTKSGFSLSTVTLNYATSDGTAAAGSDYTSASGTLSFSWSQYSKTITVATINDAVDEPNETLNVTLSSPSSGGALSDWVGVGTINDND